MEPISIEEAYQLILHDLDRLTENVLMLREACVQSKASVLAKKEISMEDVVEFLKGLPTEIPVATKETPISDSEKVNEAFGRLTKVATT